MNEPPVGASDYRALVCITTCRRLQNLLAYLPHFAAFCQDDPRFSLLVSLDGTEVEYLSFCEEWDVPLVYSDEREGVGLSKNRVLQRFPDFDYYFFLEDDAELVSGEVFPAHVEVSRESGIHHFSLFERGGVRRPTGESQVAGHRIVHGMFGGGQFNLFTRAGLERVGGWHTLFAQYRRWGHTEHSYRFYRSGLAPAPFNVIEGLCEALIWHMPPPVTRVDGAEFDDNQLAVPERELLERQLEFVPVETLSPRHFNDKPFGEMERLAGTLGGDDRYPLVRGKQRTAFYSDYHLWRGKQARTWRGRMGWLARSLVEWPGNPRLRHYLKGLLSAWK